MVEVDLDVDAFQFGSRTDELASAFRRGGIEPLSIEKIWYRAAEVLPWVIVVSLGTPIAAFFQSFGAEAGKDAYATVKAWLREIRGMVDRPGTIEVRAPGGTTVVLRSDLPDEALDALHDLPPGRLGCVVWDPSQETWLRYQTRPLNLGGAFVPPPEERRQRRHVDQRGANERQQ
jgi:hypothetical protein